MELLFTGMSIDDNERKRALLIHYAGERVFDIYEAEKGETLPTFAATKQVLSDIFFWEKPTNESLSVQKL